MAGWGARWNVLNLRPAAGTRAGILLLRAASDQKKGARAGGVVPFVTSASIHLAMFDF
jgi:hypothetical protein